MRNDYGERVVLERVETPRGEIQLQQRGEHYEIIQNGTFIMASYNGESEKQMIDLALKHVSRFNAVNVLIGGIGMGFTLQSALKYLVVNQATVVEIERVIVDWNHKYFSGLNDNAAQNPRTYIVIADICDYLKDCTKQFHVIALDIDNGPDWVVYNGNQVVYSLEFLTSVKDRLIPGGALIIWSATRNGELFETLGNIFSNVEVKASEEEDAFIFLSINCGTKNENTDPCTLAE